MMARNTMSTTLIPPVTQIDPKRRLWLWSPAVPVTFIAAAFAYAWSGQWLWLLYAPLIIHVILPVLDQTLGEDFSNPSDESVVRMETDLYYRALVWAYVPSQIIGTVLGAWLVANRSMPWYAYAALVFLVGAINGVGIGTGHELGHKKEKWDQWLSKLALAPSMYGHFFVEHNRGHHKNVATPGDPASARMGESFWAFLPRTVIGSLRSAWSLEKQRLARQGLSVWSVDNDNLQAWAMTVVLFGALTLWLGWPVLLFLVLQGVYAASMLESVNYVEHYGLLRAKDASGAYVRCAPEHSWNSNHIVGNLILYHLQRHSDHHANPARRYQSLRHFEEAPQLPSGYAALITVAYVPALWFALMDHRVMKHYGGDIHKANVHPPAAERLLARWGRA
jgi:alkane 1-monooxygenase